MMYMMPYVIVVGKFPFSFFLLLLQKRIILKFLELKEKHAEEH